MARAAFTNCIWWVPSLDNVSKIYCILCAEKTALNQAESYPLKEIVLGFKTNA